MPARTAEQPRRTAEEITTAQAVASYLETNNARKSALALGISRKRLARHLDEAGIVRRVRLDPKKVAASYERTGSCTQTAKEFGVSARTISGLLDRLSIPRTGSTNKGIATAHVVASYRRTKSTKKTAAELKISDRTVRYHLDKAGVARQDQTATLDTNDLIAAYARDRSIIKVAAEFAVHPSTVAARLDQVGIARDGNKVAVEPAAVAVQFERTRSLVATGKQLGISHNAVGRILDRNGYSRPKHNPFTPEQIAESYARAKSCAQAAEELGIHSETVRLHLAALGIERRTYFPATRLFSTEQLRELLHELAAEKLPVARFAEIKGLSRQGLMRTWSERIPAEYDAVVTQNRGWSKTGEERKKGWNFEHLCCNALRRAGFHVYYSPRSIGPADIIAFSATGQSYAIQAKLGGNLPPKEWNAVIEHAQLTNAIPVLVAYKGYDLAFWRLLDRKSAGRRTQPAERIDLLGEKVEAELAAQLAA